MLRLCANVGVEEFFREDPTAVLNGALKFLQVFYKWMNLLPLWLGEKVFIRAVCQSLYPTISFVVSNSEWMWWEILPEHKGTCSGNTACSSWEIFALCIPSRDHGSWVACNRWVFVILWGNQHRYFLFQWEQYWFVLFLPSRKSSQGPTMCTAQCSKCS